MIGILDFLSCLAIGLLCGFGPLLVVIGIENLVQRSKTERSGPCL